MRTSQPDGSLVPRNKYLLGVAVASFVVGFLEATGIILVPFGSMFSRLTGSVVSSAALNSFMARYGYASVFSLMALESASFPVPSEVVLPLAGYFVYLGTMNFWAAVLVSTGGSLVGAMVDYFLAMWLGRPFALGLLKLVRIHKGALDRAEAWFGRSAQWTVFAARFVPGLRTLISLPAGLFEMSLPRFVAMTIAGCLLWSVVLIYAGFLAGSAATSTFASSPTVIDGLSGLVAATSAAYIVYFFAFGRKPGVSPPSSAP